MRSTYSVPTVPTGLACVLGLVSLTTASMANESFGPPAVLSNLQARCVLPLDVDEDGDLDVVLADADGDRIGWCENLGGGLFDYDQTVISYGVDSPRDLILADVDGDGDDDLLSASSGDGKIAWYEFLGGGDFGVQQVITTDADGARSVSAADLDGDGDTDVVCASTWDNTIAWYENDGFQNFTEVVISDTIGAPGQVEAVDLDGTGGVDLLFTDSEGGKLAWYENDGSGNFAAPQVIEELGNYENSSFLTVDIDGDGDLDVLSNLTAEDRLVWFEALGGGAFGGSHQVSTHNGIEGFYAADIDGDGDVDVTSFRDLEIAIHENLGAGSFGPRELIGYGAGGLDSLAVADLDGEGHVDILFCVSMVEDHYEGQIAWCQGGSLFGLENDLPAVTSYSELNDVLAEDPDADGDLDVVAAWELSDRIVWYENLGNQAFATEQIISLGVADTQDILTADLDGDGDPDLLSASEDDDKVAWYENLGGGIFGPQQVITLDADYAQDVDAADLDGDGDLDVLSASMEDAKVAWYENLGGGTFGPQQVITTDLPDAYVAQAVDLDGDGNVDVLTVNENEQEVVWFENQGGGAFDPKQTLYAPSNEYVEEICTADIDGDGDPDVLVASDGMDDGINRLVWIENLGWGAFGASVEIVQSAWGIDGIQVTDVDGDGDLDPLTRIDEEIRWYENLGGGSYHRWTSQSTYGEFDAFCAGDLDGDGVQDIVSGGEVHNYEGLLCWTENRMGGLPPITAYCFGDGTGGACPCGNHGLLGEGCANSTSHGSHLSAVGEPSVGFDSLLLVAHHIPMGMSCLFFQGDTPVGGGVPFGDGLRCIGPPFVRLEVGFELGTGAALTQSPISIAGGVLPGQTKYYQCWYRDAGASPCGFEFNLSNGVSVVWGP